VQIDCPPVAWSIRDADPATLNQADPYAHVESLLARARYREAAATIIAHPDHFRNGSEADAALHVARALAEMHDLKTAHVLWKRYLSDKTVIYQPQAQRLKANDAKGFFKAMLADSANFTSGHPDDADAGALLKRGATAGAAGDTRSAFASFQKADPIYNVAYSYYASASAAWLLGDRKNAERGWLCGSDAGRPLPPGDMGFNNVGNVAAVTMLLSFW